MNDERIIELINAGIDGEINDSEKSELQNILNESSEARELQAGMQALANTLSDLPQHEPPDNLRTQILENSNLPGRRSSPSSLFELPAIARYGLAFAAGLMLMVGIYQFGPRESTPEDLSRMTGTISTQDALGDAVLIDNYMVDQQGISGSVSLQTHGDAYVVDFDLQSSMAVEVLVKFAAEGLQFDRLVQSDNKVVTATVADGSVRLNSSGNRQFSIYLDRREDSPADQKVELTTEIYGSGTRLHQGVLKTQ
jgi:hypothetical protein